uniref:F-ATPase gamma subunit n=1 Tax=Hirondellea gigas TaxID=1518452 RepID=A0A6A7FPB7_9CRUS
MVQQECGMATLKQISMRLKSVKNIQKITRSMKMVSAAKYARAERELKSARPYGAGTTAFYEKIEPEAVPNKPNQLIIAMSSDRGLCGGIHSAVCRIIKAEVAASPHPENIAIVCVGDKSRAQLSRVIPQNILFQVNEVGRKAATFEDASAIATAVINSGYEYGSGKILYNKFKSVVSYKTTVLPIYNLESITAAEKLGVYDSLDADVVQCYLRCHQECRRDD